MTRSDAPTSMPMPVMERIAALGRILQPVGQIDSKARRRMIENHLSRLVIDVPSSVPRELVDSLKAVRALVDYTVLREAEVNALCCCLRRLAALLLTQGLPALPPEPEPLAQPAKRPSVEEYAAGLEAEAAGIDLGTVAAVGAAVVAGGLLIGGMVSVLGTVGAAASAAVGGGLAGKIASRAASDGTAKLVGVGLEHLCSSPTSESASDKSGTPPDPRVVCAEWKEWVGLGRLPRSYDRVRDLDAERRATFDEAAGRHREQMRRYEGVRALWVQALSPLNSLIPDRDRVQVAPSDYGVGLILFGLSAILLFIGGALWSTSILGALTFLLPGLWVAGVGVHESYSTALRNSVHASFDWPEPTPLEYALAIWTAGNPESG